MKKNDIYIILVLVAVAVGIFCFNMYGRKDGETVLIYYDNNEYERVSLKEDKVIKVNDINVVKIENGEAFMESADCPDQICVHQKPIKSSGRDIVCLPNKVVIRVISEEKEVDMVVK